MRFRIRIIAAFSILFVPSLAFAQHTPLQGATGGATGNSYESVSDDVLRSFVTKHRDGLDAAGEAGAAGFNTDAFATGRIRTTQHDGYAATTLNRSTPFNADEWSLFGSVGVSNRGFQFPEWHGFAVIGPDRGPLL